MITSKMIWAVIVLGYIWVSKDFLWQVVFSIQEMFSPHPRLGGETLLERKIK